MAPPGHLALRPVGGLVLALMAMRGAAGRHGTALLAYGSVAEEQKGTEGLTGAELNATTRFFKVSADVGSVLNLYDTVNYVASILKEREQMGKIAHAELTSEGDWKDDLQLECQNVQANLEMLDTIDEVLKGKLGFKAIGHYQCEQDDVHGRHTCLKDWTFSDSIESNTACSMGLKEIVNELHIMRSELFKNSYHLLSMLSSEMPGLEDAVAIPALNGSIMDLDTGEVFEWLKDNDLGEFPQLDESANGRVLANLAARGMLRLFLGKVKKVKRGEFELTDMTDKEAIKVYCAIKAATGGAPSGSCGGRGALDLHKAAKEMIDPWVQVMLKSLNGKYTTTKWLTKTFILSLGLVEKTVPPGRWNTLQSYIGPLKNAATRFVDLLSSGLAVKALVEIINKISSSEGVPPAAAMLATSLAAVTSMSYLYDQFQKRAWTDCKSVEALLTKSSIWNQIEREPSVEASPDEEEEEEVAEEEETVMQEEDPAPATLRHRQPDDEGDKR